MADESLATAVAKRLRNQPFLFVLGIAALLIGVLSSGAGFGTPELRIILAMIGGLAFLVVIGYYVLAVLRVRNAGPGPAVLSANAAPAPDPAPAPPGPARTPEPAPTYNVSAPSSVIGAIGSNATITMNNAPPPVAAPPPAAAAQASPSADEIDRARRNLTRLESKRALYAAGTEPRELLDEIAREQRRLAELTAPGRGAAPPDGGRSG